MKLTAQLAFPLQTAAGAQPFRINPAAFPGFMDYYTTYSQFRLLKATTKVHLTTAPRPAGQENVLTDQIWTYLKVSSRPFVESVANSTIDINSDGTSVRDGITNETVNNLATVRSLNDLRQSRWQKQYYPSDVKNALTFKWKPYTLQWTGRPFSAFVDSSQPGQNAQEGMSYLQAVQGTRWMPMSFTGVSNLTGWTPGSAPQLSSGVVFFGPYLLRLNASESDTQSLEAWNPVCTVSLYLQFRGQK